MKGLVKRSFIDRTYGVFRAVEGQVIDIPPGVDWVKAGLVEPIGPVEPDAGGPDAREYSGAGHFEPTTKEWLEEARSDGREYTTQREAIREEDFVMKPVKAIEEAVLPPVEKAVGRGARRKSKRAKGKG